MSDLVMHRVVKHYSSGDEVIRAAEKVSLSVRGGELVALYGPSGAGKSTLLLLAAGLLAPDAGAVSFDGRDLSRLSPEEEVTYLRHEVGFIYQSFHLMAGVSCVDNAALKLLADHVPLRAARRTVEPWLDRVGLAGRLRHTPDQLSGGERQRVAVVRALVNQPRLILADEPTGNLDTKRGVEILRLLADTCHTTGAAGLLVTHDPQAAAIADRVFVVRDGILTSTAPSQVQPAGNAIAATPA